MVWRFDDGPLAGRRRFRRQRAYNAGLFLADDTMTTLLALDTATEACSVALLHAGRMYSRYYVIPRPHAQRLMPMVQEELSEAGLVLSALEGIALGRGPGPL